jgi:predicted transcriptional regulator
LRIENGELRMEELENINIVKKVCKELGVTQKELAEMLEVSPASVSDWSKGQIPKMTQLALEQMIELKELKEKFEILKKAHRILSE